ncbi:MAG: hypothetical protein H0Z37_10570 [Firmicutes bacterium]|nr:hypothetical protein [Bacillota bacterium]
MRAAAAAVLVGLGIVGILIGRGNSHEAVVALGLVLAMFGTMLGVYRKK